MSERRRPLLFVLLASAALVTVVIHGTFVPEYFPDDIFMTGLALIVGWVAYTVVFYAVGRLTAEPTTLPSMRLGDIGLALFLVSVLLAAGLDALGFTPELLLGVYALPGIGVYVGLALFGWSIGRRTEAINAIVR
ncbi:hypothetical protein [Natronolimnohabitans innermongolicus]|uniref:Uncharacterized protein n=1 Tax=Natronolimnohabitans innermongolicus JCM 12255 TaxID=1227499 RepID=L9WU06_9EURY|nr:hypothetical protein [Natronolimnohabitans innermongolicus]ELY52940.1 hypothetical protein C493_15368 [Natronolimnohabitans innermongolicus JCM 12255]